MLQKSMRHIHERNNNKPTDSKVQSSQVQEVRFAQNFAVRN